VYFATATATPNSGAYRPPADDLDGARRRDHRAVARAPILVTVVMLHRIRQLDGGDPLRVFGLPRHLGEGATARRTRALVKRPLVVHRDDRQRRLRPRPMPRPRWSRRLRGRWRVSGGREHLCAPLLQRPQLGERQLFGIRQSTQARVLGRQLQGLRDEALVFAFEEETDLPQGVDIAFLRQINHSRAFDHRGRSDASVNCVTGGGDNATRPTIVLPSSNRSSSLTVSVTGASGASRHSRAKRPRSSRFA